MGKYTMYRDNRREWRWRFKATNGNTIGVSSEGYVDRRDCRRSVEIMKESTDAPVEVEEE